MNKIRILMIDDNVKLIEAVKEYFKNSDEIKIVLEEHNGLDGFETAKNKIDEYDIILLDLIMPKKDGLYVLESLQRENINKKIIVETSYNASDVIREVSEYGVNYLILKPFDLIDLEKKIKNLFKQDENQIINFGNSNLQISISKMLHDLGIPSHIKGYQFLRDALNILFHNPDVINAITKELYSELAVKYNINVARVERSIRHAIEVSWTRGNINVIESIFGNSLNINKDKPTNSEFMATLSEKLRLEFNKVG